MTRTPDEPEITLDDLQRKLEGIEEAVKERAQQKIMGLSTVALGGIVLGVGALGLAYWLGRRSLPPAVEPTRFAGGTTGGATEPRAKTLSSLFDPVVEAAVKSAVNALTDRLSDRPGGGTHR